VEGANPDFLVEHTAAGLVVLEVYEPEYLLPRNPDGSYRSGFVSSQEFVVRRGINSGRKSRQAAAARDRHIPFVLVLANTNSEMAIGDHVIPGALFGTPQITWPVGPGANPDNDEGRLLFGPGGRLQENLNTRFSAVAVVTRFAKGLARIERLADERMASGMLPSEKIVTFLTVQSEEAEAGRFIEADEGQRLQLFHNPFAAVLLSMEFAGPHDDQWNELERGKSYAQVAQGILGDDVPGRYAIGGSRRRE
jgi:hypothetical protein